MKALNFDEEIVLDFNSMPEDSYDADMQLSELIFEDEYLELGDDDINNIDIGAV